MVIADDTDWILVIFNVQKHFEKLRVGKIIEMTDTFVKDGTLFTMSSENTQQYTAILYLEEVSGYRV